MIEKSHKRFFSVKEAANYTSLSSRLIYRTLKERDLRSYRIGRKIVLDRADLDSFILGNEVMSSEKLREFLEKKLDSKKKVAGRK